MKKSSPAELDSILQKVLDVPDDAREAFLDETCGRNTDLRAIVADMLRACDDRDSPIVAGGAMSGPLWQELVRTSSAARLEPGERVAAYRIVRAIGHGGMATVYLAERADGQFQQQVALKILHPSKHSDEVGRRFDQERQILAGLSHPNIAHLLDAGVTAGGEPFVAMEYVEGQPIDSYCDEHGFTVRERLQLFLEVVGALGHAHRNLIIHRDIKPSNVLVSAEGLPKLLDFGIAKLLDTSLPHAAPETRSALHPMTPEYASPEQIRGEPLGTASDIYQLGYLLYRLIAGRSPYRTERRNYAAILDAICRHEPIPPSKVLSTTDVTDDCDATAISDARGTCPERLQRLLAGDLDTIVLKALRKEPDARYPSTESLSADIERYLAGLPVAARRGSFGYRAKKYVNRHRWGVAATSAFILLASGFTAVYAVQTAKNTAELASERDAAKREAAKAEQVAGFLAGMLDNAKPDRTKGEEVTVVDLLDAGAQRVENELADQPEIQARMLEVIADSYFELGVYEQAVTLSRNQADIEAKLWSANDPRIGRTLRRQGEFEYFDGDHVAAQKSLERALTLHAPGEQGNGERGRTLSSLGLVLRALGNLEAARAAHEQSLPLVEGLGDREYIRRAWMNYGNLLLVTSAYDDAARAYRRALDLHDDLETTRAAGLMANLGMATAAADRPADGLVYFERATEIFEKLLPPNHPSLAKLYSASAECLLMLKRYDESYELQFQALEVYESALGAGHFETHFSLMELGDVLLYTGRPAIAETQYRRALNVVSESSGSDNINAARAIAKLGTARLRQGDPSGAEEWFRKALPIHESALGSDNVETNSIRTKLALALTRQQRIETARTVFDQAMKMARRGLAGGGDDDIAATEAAYGEYLLAIGNAREAESILRPSYDALKDHSDQAAVGTLLGLLRASSVTLGKSEDAADYASLHDDLLASMQSLHFADQSVGEQLTE